MVRLDVYGRYEVDVAWVDGRWVVYRSGEGKRRALNDLSIPPEVSEEDLAGHPDDLLHEEGRPGTTIRRIR